MFNRSQLSPKELEAIKEKYKEYLDISVKIATIQYICKMQKDAVIGPWDRGYELPGSNENSNLIKKNEELVQLQLALLPRARELGNLIPDDNHYNAIVIEAGKIVKDAANNNTLKYPDREAYLASIKVSKKPNNNQ